MTLPVTTKSKARLSGPGHPPNGPQQAKLGWSKQCDKCVPAFVQLDDEGRIIDTTEAGIGEDLTIVDDPERLDSDAIKVFPTVEQRYGPWLCMGCGRPHKLGEPCSPNEGSR